MHDRVYHVAECLNETFAGTFEIQIAKSDPRHPDSKSLEEVRGILADAGINAELSPIDHVGYNAYSIQMSASYATITRIQRVPHVQLRRTQLA